MKPLGSFSMSSNLRLCSICYRIHERFYIHLGIELPADKR